jgi:hypothetical protein
MYEALPQLAPLASHQLLIIVVAHVPSVCTTDRCQHPDEAHNESPRRVCMAAGCPCYTLTRPFARLRPYDRRFIV